MKLVYNTIKVQDTYKPIKKSDRTTFEVPKESSSRIYYKTVAERICQVFDERKHAKRGQRSPKYFLRYFFGQNHAKQDIESFNEY